MIRAVVAGALVLLAACDQLSGGNATERASAARDFPRADRPIAPIVSTRWPIFSSFRVDRANSRSASDRPFSKAAVSSPRTTRSWPMMLL